MDHRLFFVLVLALLISCSGDIGGFGGLRSDAGSGGGGAAGIGGGGAGGVLGAGGVPSPTTPECGNGVVEAQESCDPAETCAVECDDGNACTVDVLFGSPETCDVVCEASLIEVCIDGDGCCPAGCGAIDDDDCSPTCGNGTLDDGETCDPIAQCPSSCDDQNACTTDLLTGSADNCNVACSHTTVSVCVDGDGCCPVSCSESDDNDCQSSPMCGGAGPETTALDDEEQAFLVLLNQHRNANGRSSVAACRSLSRAAQGHSEDMRDEDYFDHTGLDGSSPIDRACNACYASCSFTGWGENIAAGNADAQGTFDQWVNSPGHNANMLGSNFAVVGIGRAIGGGTYGVYWTTVFGGQTDESCQ